MVVNLKTSTFGRKAYGILGSAEERLNVARNGESIQFGQMVDGWVAVSSPVPGESYITRIPIC